MRSLDAIEAEAGRRRRRRITRLVEERRVAGSSCSRISLAQIGDVAGRRAEAEREDAAAHGVGDQPFVEFHGRLESDN
jgi:hypothetical protein